MSQHRIKTILIFITFTIAIVLGTIALLCMDAAPPEDGDLRLAKLGVPDEENAFSLLAEAGRRFSFPDGMGYDWESMQDDPPNDRVPWRDDAAMLMLSRNKKALEIARRALICNASQAPPPDAELKVKAKYISALMRVKGDLLCRQGSHRYGFDSFVDAVRIAHLVEISDCGTRRGSILRLKFRVLERMVDNLASADLDHNALMEYCSTLDANRMTDDQFVRMLKMDYVAICGDVDQLADPAMLPVIREAFPELRFVSCTPYHYQPNRTKGRLAAIFRSTLKRLPRDCTRLPRRSLSMTFYEPYSSCKSIVGMIPALFERNAIGAVHHAPAAGAISDAIWTRQENSLRISALQILMALKCHKRDSGQLPRSLGELVPAHLRAIPADDYDGKPLRYSPEKKMIYSVGEDLTDDGGSADKDIVFKVEF